MLDLFSAAADVFGSVLGANRQNAIAADQRQFGAEQIFANERMQREFAQHGVRWRVEDAKAAGLHPLFALGANVSQASPNPPMSFENRSGEILAEGFGRMGQNLSRAARAQGTPEERALQAAQLAAVGAATKRDEAQAAYYYSLAAREDQARVASKPIPMGVMTQPVHRSQVESRQIDDLIQGQPDMQTSVRREDPSVTSGLHGALREYTITPGGLRMRLPYSEEGPGEALENIPWYAWPAMIQHQRGYYGDDWGTRFLKEFVWGKSPRYRRYPSEEVRREEAFYGGY